MTVDGESAAGAELSTLRIRAAEPGDADRIKAIAVAAGMFTEDEVGFFDEMLDGFFDGSLDGHRWLVLETTADGRSEGQPGDHGWSIQAAAQYAPEPFADRLWNLYFIAVDPHAQGGGYGGRLMARVEQELRAIGQDEARVLVVETSSTDQYTMTREFYPKQGFVEEARVRQFYGPDDDKVIFWKSLVG